MVVDEKMKLSKLSQACVDRAREARKELLAKIDSEEDKMEVLSNRESQVAKLVTQGLSNRDIGKELGISVQTVKNHITKVLYRLNINNRSKIAIHFSSGNRTMPVGDLICPMCSGTGHVSKIKLTNAEKEVMLLVGKGFTNKEIAEQRNISVQTVKNHITSVNKKFGASSRVDAMKKLGWLKQ